ncbi:hypothetical protein D1007_54970 [Hordeum vulgare]|nr:hypothetical protein D1007_54970 [Hordeum vulgare]
MVHGTLEVLLVGAKGLENTDYLCKGSNPEWNESFVFTVSDQAAELVIKLMDSDSGTADDFVGEATMFARVVSPRTSVDGNNHIEKNKDAREALRP